jgi:hypothetical protein
MVIQSSRYDDPRPEMRSQKSADNGHGQITDKITGSQ